MYVYETEIEELAGRFFATVAIEYGVNPGEPMVPYYPDGSGYPGSSTEVVDVVVTVTSLSSPLWDKTRKQLGALTPGVDKLAQAHIENELEHGLADDLLEYAGRDNELA